jgi:hypothetical protein
MYKLLQNAGKVGLSIFGGFAILMVVLMFFGVGETDPSIEEQRLAHCQILATDIDDLLAEVGKDRETVYAMFTDYINGDISDDKMVQILDELTTRVSQQDYQYQLTIDKNNDKCFGL